MKVSKVTDLRKELGMGKHEDVVGALQSLQKAQRNEFLIPTTLSLHFSLQNIPQICLPSGSPPHRLCGYHHPIFIQLKKVSFCMVNIPKY